MSMILFQKLLASCSYIIRNLVKSHCPTSSVLQVYNACIRSGLLYAFPVFCNCSISLQKRILAFEKRECRIMQTQPAADVLQVANAICSRLFDKIESSANHPLRCMFDERAPSSRNPRTLKIPQGRTKRFTSSFVKFSR